MSKIAGFWGSCISGENANSQQSRESLGGKRRGLFAARTSRRRVKMQSKSNWLIGHWPEELCMTIMRVISNRSEGKRLFISTLPVVHSRDAQKEQSLETLCSAVRTMRGASGHSSHWCGGGNPPAVTPLPSPSAFFPLYPSLGTFPAMAAPLEQTPRRKNSLTILAFCDDMSPSS